MDVTPGSVLLVIQHLRVFVLDDGARPWVERLAREFRFEYVSREDNAGFKAGNLNNGLRNMRESGYRPEFIAVFDADFVAKPIFISRTLSLFSPGYGGRIGMVQTPQYFFNPDPFQYALGAQSRIPDEQRNWFDFRLACADANGSVICCGTSFLARMDALDECGHFPTESICEDAFTSVVMRRKGWATAYLNEVLSMGLAPEGAAEYLTQRYRWCVGWLQISRIQWLRHGGKVTVRDRLKFLEQIARWPYPSVMRICWALLPISALFADATVYAVTPEEYLAVILPLTVGRLGLNWLAGFSLMPFFSDGQVLFLAPTILKASWRFATGREAERFSVTEKDVSREDWVFHWKLARIPGTLLIATMLTLMVTVLDGSESASLGKLGMMFWAMINCFGFYVALIPCFEPPQTRRSCRFAPAGSAATVSVSGYSPEIAQLGKLIDVSEFGARLSLPMQMQPQVGDRLMVGIGGLHERRVRIVRNYGDGGIGVEFEQGDAERRELISWIYCHGGLVQERRTWRFFGAIGAVVRHALGRTPHRKQGDRKVAAEMSQ
ncbi:hypothetical protein DMQ71_26725 [Klebsiella quasipneumoniae]|nr:hypothetical protein DMQ71_26725 [Klebsiella quasipneumoniae]